MEYEIWVGSEDGSQRFDLVKGGTDPGAASELVAGLVAACSGTAVSIGVTIRVGGGPTPTPPPGGVAGGHTSRTQPPARPTGR